MAALYKLVSDQLEIPSALDCWSLSKFPLDFFSQLEAAQDFPLESLLHHVKQGWVGAPINRNVTTDKADSYSQPGLPVDSDKLTTIQISRSIPLRTSLGHLEAGLASDSNCIELFGQSFSSADGSAPCNRGGGESMHVSEACHLRTDTSNDIVCTKPSDAIISTATSTTIASAPFQRMSGSGTGESHTTADFLLPSRQFLQHHPTILPIRAVAPCVGTESHRGSPGHSLPVHVSAKFRTSAVRSPSSLGGGSSGAAAACMLAADNSEVGGLFCDKTLHPVESSFERASWVLTQYRSAENGASSFVIPCQLHSDKKDASSGMDVPPIRGTASVFAGKRSSPAAGSATQWSLGSSKNSLRLVPPAPAKPKLTFLDHAIVTLAPLVGPGSCCTNVGVATCLRSLMSQLTAWARRSGSGNGALPSAALPLHFSVVPWDSQCRPTLLWCIVGDKVRPEFALAAVFALQHGPAAGQTTTFFVLPLAPSVVVAAAAASTGGSVTSPTDPASLSLSEPPDVFQGVGALRTSDEVASSAPLLSRRDRWRALGSILSIPGLRKCVWDAKGSLYGILRCPLTSSSSVQGLCDPCVAAWLISPDDFGKGDVLPPAWAMRFLVDADKRSEHQYSAPKDRPSGNMSAVAGVEHATSSFSGALNGITLTAIAIAYRVTPSVSSSEGLPRHPAVDHLLLLGRVFSALESVIEAGGMMGALHGLELPLLPTVAATEVAGLAFDAAALGAAEMAIRAKLAEIEADAILVAGCDFMLSSPLQVSEVLYGRLGLEAPRVRSEAHGKQAPRKGEKRHASVDDAALAALATTGGHPLPELIRGHRKLFKLLTGALGPLMQQAVQPWDAIDNKVLGIGKNGACSSFASYEDTSADCVGEKRARGGNLEAFPSSSESAFSKAFPSSNIERGAAPCNAPPLMRLHTRLHTTVTGTGRLSSAEPNLQNLHAEATTSRVGALLAQPVYSGGVAVTNESGASDSSKKLHNVRSAFKPRHAGWVIVSVDFSQIEMRIMAHMCRDKLLLSVFNTSCDSAEASNRSDIYCSMASHVFSVPVAAVNAEQRKQAKVVVLGICYGLGVSELAAKLLITDAQATLIRSAFITTFPGLRSWIASAHAYGRRYGFVPTLTGRLRPLPGYATQTRSDIALAERQSVNSIIQGSAADLIKSAMVLVDHSLRCGQGPLGWTASGAGTMMVPRLLMQVHDELLFESPPGEPLERLVANITRIMTVEAAQYVASISPFFMQQPAIVDSPAMYESGLETLGPIRQRPAWVQDAALLLGGTAHIQVPLLVNIEVGSDWGSLTPFKAIVCGGVIN